jgi:hypothetical protein
MTSSIVKSDLLNHNIIETIEQYLLEPKMNDKLNGFQYKQEDDIVLTEKNVPNISINSLFTPLSSTDEGITYCMDYILNTEYIEEGNEIRYLSLIDCSKKNCHFQGKIFIYFDYYL